MASPTSESLPFTPRAKMVLELSLREALQIGHNYIGTEHMLLGLVREGKGVAARVLLDLGADLQRARQEVIQRLSAAGPVNIGKHAAVDGDLVEGSDIPVGPADLLGSEDAIALLLSGPLLVDARMERSEVSGIVYETCTYHPRLPPEISVSVAGAVVTREAFDRSTSGSAPDAELIDGLGDAATYSPAQNHCECSSGRRCSSSGFVATCNQGTRPSRPPPEPSQHCLERKSELRLLTSGFASPDERRRAR